jgi:transcription initiation factor TFIIE subunit alpha
LEIAHTFDPSTNAFLCEVCSTELVEDDPALHGDDTGGQDRMQRFNVATAPIRDALKSIEGARLPTINIVAWIAQNVTTEAIPDAAAASADGRKFDVVMGAEDDTAAREKLAEEQRAQNALPVWYTHSTITGDTTALGNKDAADKAKLLAAGGRVAGAKEGQDEDDALAAHYANMDDDDEEELEEADMGDGGAAATPTPVQTAEDTPVPAVMVMVAGVAKALAEVTDADEGVMTEEEYEAYFEAISASQQ